MAGNEGSKTGEKSRRQPPESKEQGQSFNLRTDVPAELRHASFPAAVRGYDRRAVDAYVNRVNHVIAELEVSRSPQAAVRHAVERVSEQTKGILQQARESAEKITTTAREEAAEIIGGAKAEAAELVVGAGTEADRLGAESEQTLANARAEGDGIIARSKADGEKIVADANAEATENRRRSEEEIAALREEAETRLGELQADTEAVWRQRHEIIGEIDGMATRLQEAASAAAARLTRTEPKEAEVQAASVLPPDAEAEAEPTLVVGPNQPTEVIAPPGRGRAAKSRKS